MNILARPWRTARFGFFLRLVMLCSVTLQPAVWPVAAAGQAAIPSFVPYKSFGCLDGAITTGDFNSDQKTDVAVYTTNQICLLFQHPLTGELRAPITITVPYTAPESSTRHIASGDLNGDGRDDLVVTMSVEYLLQVWTQEANGVFERDQSFPIEYWTDAPVVADVNHDSRMDVVISDNSSPSIGVFYQSSTGVLGPKITYPAVISSGNLVVGDLNDDGRIDVVKMNSAFGIPDMPDIIVYRQISDGMLGPYDAYDHAGWPGTGVATGDVTGDGLIDIVTSHNGNENMHGFSVFAQTVSGTLLLSSTVASLDNPEMIQVKDVNMDSKADIVLLHGGSSLASVFLQPDSGALGPYLTYLVPSQSGHSAQSLAVADLNDDSFPDLLVSTFAQELSILYHTTGDLAPSVRSSPEIIMPNEPFTLTIKVHNSGPLTATNVVVTNTLPVSATFVSAVSSEGVCNGTAQFTCNLDRLGVEATATMTIVANAPETTGSVLNVSEVYAIGDPGIDDNKIWTGIMVSYPTFLPNISNCIWPTCLFP